MERRSHDIGTLVGNVVLHSSLPVDRELDALIYGTAQSSVVLAGILVISIVLGIVDMIFRSVAAEALGGDLELLRTIAKTQEAKNAKEKSDSFGRNRLDRADIDGLRVISKPVAEVDTRDHKLVELLASNGSCHQDRKKGILDIAMTP